MARPGMNVDDRESLIDEIRALIRDEVRTALCSAGPLMKAGAGEAAGGVLSGDVRYFRLPEVLHMVAQQGLTGRLSMSSAGRHVDIYFRSGEIAYATGEAREAREQLGSLLVNMGRLTQGALDEALSKYRAGDERIGRVLVEHGIVPVKDIRAALMKQTERSVYKAMAWGEGRFVFELAPLPDFVEDIPLGLKSEDLVMEGVRRVSELRMFYEKFPRMDAVFTKPDYSHDEFEGMDLKPDERRVLELVDGERDVSALIGASGLDEFGLLKALYALYTEGIIKKAAGGKTGRTQYL